MMNEEYTKDKRLYDMIFARIEELLANGAAIDTYWGRDKHGEAVLSPYDSCIELYSLHGAATVASIEVLQKMYNRVPKGAKGCIAHRATIMSERFFMERHAERAIERVAET